MTPHLRIARFDDYAGIAAVMAVNGLHIRPEREWRRQWTDHPWWPRLAGHWPIGWVLDTSGDDITTDSSSIAGSIAGAIVSVPSAYRFRGRDLLCANGRGWCVLPEYRSLAMWLMDEYLQQPGADLFINTTVGPTAAPTLDHLARRVPVGNFEQAGYWIVNYRRVAADALRTRDVPLAGALAWPAGAALHLRDRARAVCRRSRHSSSNAVTIDRSGAFDARFDEFWRRLDARQANILLGVRDAPTLNWHFAAALATNRLRLFTASRDARLSGYAVFTIEGAPNDLRRLRLADYQAVDDDPESALLPAFVDAARAQAAADRIDVVEYWGLDVPATRRLDHLAPHRRELAAWPYFYRTNDRALADELECGDVWAPSLYDGDASVD